MAFSCTICTDIFVSSDDIHVTPCGHAFHYLCILQWLERSKTCPECRNKCIATSLTKVYMNITTNVDNPGDNAMLMQNLDNLKLSLREKDTKLKNLEDSQAAHKLERKKMKKLVASLEGTIKGQDCILSTLRHEMDKLRAEQTAHQRLKEDMKKMENKMQLMKTVEMAIGSSTKEIEDLVASNSNPQTLAVLVTSLKRELQASEFKRNELRDRIKTYQNDLHKERAKCKDLEDKLSTSDSEIYRLQREVDALSKRKADTDEDPSDSSVVLNTPDQPVKRKRKFDDFDMNKSTPVADKVRNIIASDSPFLPIRASAFGLHPVFRKGLSAAALSRKESTTGTALTKTTSDLSDKVSGSLQPAKHFSIPSSSASNLVGGLMKKENAPSMLVPLTTGRIVTINRGMKKKAASSSNLAASNTAPDDFLELDLDS
ncbi:AAEL014744-PA [Aedes aegypti]|uniref:AAEL014744-PA n=2 Tax=Aedes aegypti TaxID=7159 RepID=A0A1S4G2N4_AEDAE|nr:E3 ubiquitin-protein ligase TRAIP [Aedes aegypti]EAT32998.1 AAEL014744-PA [Aedes aegypti]